MKKLFRKKLKKFCLKNHLKNKHRKVYKIIKLVDKNILMDLDQEKLLMILFLKNGKYKINKKKIKNLLIKVNKIF